MAETIKAGFFHVITETAAAEIEGFCATRANDEANDKHPFETTVDLHDYRLTDTAWDKKSRIFTGTIYLVRTDRLPRKLTDTTDEKLPLEVDESLGEPASFAYQPYRSRGLVEYNHTGPRQSAVRGFIYKLGVATAVDLHPMETKDALQRMKNAAVVKKLEFMLAGRDGIEAVRDIGLPVGRAIDLMTDVDGYTIRVTISMGRHEGGLGENVKNIAERLAQAGTLVKAVKVSAKQTEADAPKILDLLGARLTTELQVLLVGRELNHEECRKKLAQLLALQT